MFLELRDLCKRFGDQQVVNHLSLSLEQGELLCMLGASGCGKTTTLKMLGGFLEVDEGEILADGVRMNELPPERRPISTVFQSYALFPHMTVLENVIYGLKFQGIPRKKAREKGMEYLELVGLSNEASRRIQEISGGQQQRVALVRALIMYPKVLLLDEPLSNLDAKLRVKMREEIRQLQRQFGTTMIFVTHDQEEAMTLADKIAIMDQGNLIQIGTPEEVYNCPANLFAMNFLGFANALPGPDGTTIYVRPEHIQIGKTGELEGTVCHREFLGFYQQYIIKVKDMDVVVKANWDQTFSEGEPVWLHVLKTVS